jgi:hypothetical protein
MRLRSILVGPKPRGWCTYVSIGQTENFARWVVKSTALHYVHILPQRVLCVAASNERLEYSLLEGVRLTSSLFRIWTMISVELPQIISVVSGLLRKLRSVEEVDDD